MKIELKQIKIKDLFNGFKDNGEEGVFAYDGKLEIRPKYQREFVYKINQQKEVIKTILKGFPLNILYWVKTENDKYELLDGQQRTLSICSYINGDFSLEGENGTIKAFYNLTNTEKEQIENYELMVYFCEGNDKEKLDWFQTINIAGEKLLKQELRNAIYTGSWLTDAKKRFSKTDCHAIKLKANDYIKGVPIRQELLEKILKWISNDKIEEYMSKHQKDDDADELWQYFKDVLNWIEKLFPEYRKDMKGIEWGELYNKYKDKKYNSKDLEKRYQELLKDEELEGKDTNGFYYYLITGEEKHLALRTFNDKQKRIAFETQKEKCPKCKKIFKIEEMEGDHIVAWSKGGKTTQDNCQMLCKRCNGIKSDN